MGMGSVINLPVSCFGSLPRYSEPAACKWALLRGESRGPDARATPTGDCFHGAAGVGESPCGHVVSCLSARRMTGGGTKTVYLRSEDEVRRWRNNA
jgi:hypothetical protein